MMKVLTVIGARPQFIKAATVSRIIRGTGNISEVLVHTGQHYDSNMSEVFFKELEIPKPDYNLGIGGGSHGHQTGEMLIKIEEVLLKEKPNFLLVYGDTNSTLAGSLAASKLHIPVIHVEAGLRSFNMKMPEEQNRIITDHISSVLFTPTEVAIDNLKKEGIRGEKKVINIGDVMYDAALYYGKKAEKESTILESTAITKKEYILCTIHRAENTDDSVRLRQIFENLENVAHKHSVVLPLHPRTKGALSNINFDFAGSSIKFIDPVGYIDMVMLEKFSKLIITDSGGVQKEAYFHNVPCITLRDQTEWVELLEIGANSLVNNFDQLGEMIDRSLNNSVPRKDLYGDGQAANAIIDYLKNK